MHCGGGCLGMVMVERTAPETSRADAPLGGARETATGNELRVARLDVAVNEGRELGLRERADLRGLDRAVLEEHQGRDAADAVLGRRRLVLVDVELRHLQAPGV